MSDSSKLVALTALALLTACDALHAGKTSVLIQACTAEIGDASVCQCASRKTKDFTGAERYRRYAAFFAFFSERAADAKTDDDLLLAWNSAMGRYSKEANEDQFEVMRWARDIEGIHRYALKACDALPDPEREAPSLFFWGETL